MRYIIDHAVDTIQSGEPFVLATITRREGSSPRGVGASMLVTGGGTQFGTIGGGAVEFEAAKRAAQLLSSKRSETQTYRLRPNEIADLGMICGGQSWVLFQHFPADADTMAILRCLQRARQAGTPAYLVRTVKDGAVTDTGVLDQDGLHFAQGMDEAFLRTHCTSRACIVERDENGAEQVLIEPVGDGERVCIFGGGHVSQKLVPVLAYIDFRVTVCEDRPEFADEKLFPAAQSVLLYPFSDAVAQLHVTQNDYLVVMTRGHQADYEILQQALRTPATYIGCIGSRHKVAVTRQKLLDEGFSEADFARVHTPIGLPIAAETPEEIAISVAAELIAHRAKR